MRLEHGLLFVSASLTHSGKQIRCEKALIDTGSLGTIFSIEKVLDIGIRPEPDDAVRELRGVGGTEFVFIRQLDKLCLGDFQMTDFEIEIGAMDYGIDIDGIIGLNFLLQAKAKIDLERLALY